ncbi:MAG: hypothetical protein ATN36_03630 [Epulopiscium sp. Nele67-Bin005]|nr:MAG: hypothetical protein ATN36_03630 [Epulopiscium sp. Nele67-Bin005]
MKKFLSKVMLFLTISSTTLCALEIPNQQFNNDKLTLSGSTTPNQYISLSIEHENKRYFLDTIQADNNGNYSFNTTLPSNLIFDATITINGESEIFNINTNQTISPDEENNNNNNGSNPDEEKNHINVTFSVDKSSINQGYLIAPKVVETEAGSTVWDVLQAQLNAQNIDYSYNINPTFNSVYLESIDGLSEFDHGAGSGWLYFVNNTYPEYSSNLYTLKNGDRVGWQYTTNLGEDVGQNVYDEEFLNSSTSNSLLSINNETEITIEVDNDSSPSYITLTQEHSNLEQFNIYIDGYEPEVYLDLTSYFDLLPNILVKRENLQLEINHPNTLTTNKVIPLFNLLDESAQYFQLLEDNPITFSTEVTLTIIDGASSSIVWDANGINVSVPKFNSQEEALDIYALNDSSYSYIDDQNLVIKSPYLFNFSIITPTISTEIPFLDEDDISLWAKSDVLQATALGLVTGYDDNTFRPKTEVTRAEFVTILVRLLDLDNGSIIAHAPFSDVQSTNWFSSAVNIAYANNIVNGYGELFMPNKTITREEMAVMLNRALNLEEIEFSGEIEDFETISDWAKSDVLLTYAHSLINGMGDGFFPKENVTREMATVIALRAYNTIN